MAHRHLLANVVILSGIPHTPNLQRSGPWVDDMQDTFTLQLLQQLVQPYCSDKAVLCTKVNEQVQLAVLVADRRGIG